MRHKKNKKEAQTKKASPLTGIDRVAEILHRELTTDPSITRAYVMHARYWNKRGVPITTIIGSLRSHPLEEFGTGFVRCRRCAMWTCRSTVDPHTKNCAACP